MRTIGLDIGTTTICAVVIESGSGLTLESLAVHNTASIAPANSYESLQNPIVILKLVQNILERLIKKYAPITSIGLTGQMHGILYVDKKAQPVSPLYSWQDARGDLEFQDGASYLNRLAGLSGYSEIAKGYGALTHYYNYCNNLIPPEATGFCTIHNFVAMNLVECKKLIIHTSDAAGIGLYNLEQGCFDHKAIMDAGMATDMFPEVTGSFSLLGTMHGIPVSIGIGDNQASFLGAVKDMNNSVLCNLGTGGQVSILSQSCKATTPIEARPCTDGAFLLVGAVLAGGYCYELLENFFSQAVLMATGVPPPELFAAMDDMAMKYLNSHNKIKMNTQFCGTRQDSTMRASISGLDADNFTPGHLIVGLLEGIANELFAMAEAMIIQSGRLPSILVGAGNGLRKNLPLQKILEEKFKMPLHIPVNEEPAAYGAALFSLVAVGHYNTIEQAQRLIKYK